MKPSYNCAQSVLYQGGRTVAQNGLLKLDDFTEFSASYTEEFFEDILSQIEAAEALPDEQSRNAVHESLRIEMVSLGKNCTRLWQRLKRYIARAYSEDQHITQWDAAGWDDYNKATNESWDKVRALMAAANQYIADNTAQLTADSNMPASFPTAMTAATTAFNSKYDAFMLARATTPAITQQKILANCNCMSKIRMVCEDGWEIFFDDEAVRDQFSWSNITSLIAPQGASTLEVTVTNSGTNMPQNGAELSIIGTDRQAITDASGIGIITQLPADTLQCKVQADGCVEQIISVTLTGTTKRIEVTLQPVLTGEMKAGPVPVTSTETVGG